MSSDLLGAKPFYMEEGGHRCPYPQHVICFLHAHEPSIYKGRLSHSFHLTVFPWLPTRLSRITKDKMVFTKFTCTFSPLLYQVLGLQWWTLTLIFGLNANPKSLHWMSSLLWQQFSYAACWGRAPPMDTLRGSIAVLVSRGSKITGAGL